MNSQADMAGRRRDLTRRAGERLVAILLALLLAFSVPAASAGYEIDSTPYATASHRSFSSFASPDATGLTPSTEAAREFDRLRTGTPPAIMALAAEEPGRLAPVSSSSYPALDVGSYRSIATPPPGRGPPSSFLNT